MEKFGSLIHKNQVGIEIDLFKINETDVLNKGAFGSFGAKEIFFVLVKINQRGFTLQTHSISGTPQNLFFPRSLWKFKHTT